MVIKEHQELYASAFIKWGVNAQLDMLIEEMSELTTKIIHFKRNRINSNKLSEEIADVEIMLEQLKWYFTLENKVKQNKEFKLKRLEERLKRV